MEIYRKNFMGLRFYGVVWMYLCRGTFTFTTPVLLSGWWGKDRTQFGIKRVMALKAFPLLKGRVGEAGAHS